jgi:SAM-dependent methyltransferase
VASRLHPFLDSRQVLQYASWYRGAGRRAVQHEKHLLRELLRDFRAPQSVLEIGCGTGYFSRWFDRLGYDVTGLDNSPAMLGVARAQGNLRYVEGDAQMLPFPSRSFDLAAFITAMEFTGNALRVLTEAVRIARHGLLLGVLNRKSLLVVRRKYLGGPYWSAAKFLSPGELVELTRQASGDRLHSLRWRTTLWPLPMVRSLPLPWGGFIGLAARLTRQSVEPFE